jgi:hypothetical protein
LPEGSSSRKRKRDDPRYSKDGDNGEGPVNYE